MLHKSIILYLKVIDLDTYQAAPPNFVDAGLVLIFLL